MAVSAVGPRRCLGKTQGVGIAQARKQAAVHLLGMLDRIGMGLGGEHVIRPQHMDAPERAIGVAFCGCRHPLIPRQRGTGEGGVIHLQDGVGAPQGRSLDLRKPTLCLCIFPAEVGSILNRTGISDSSGGIDPDALQNVTAMASALANDAAVAQAELMMRSLVRGIKRAFEGLLRLVVAHADQPRTVRLRGEWHDMDPRAWDADMHFTVNIGLGAGSRERDLMVLQMILQLQQSIITQAGPQNPLVKPDQLYNTLATIAETAGFPSADPYFTQPDPQEIQQQLEAQQNQPTPEQIKAQEAQAKMQAQAEMEQIKAQARAQVEQAQMQADLVVEQARIEADRVKQQTKLEADAAMQSLKAELDLYKHRDTMQLEWAKLGQQAQAAEYQQFQPGSVIQNG